MKHLLITGNIQTGKSTIINRALENRTLILGGYRTVSSLRRDRNADSYVHLLSASHYEPLSPYNRVLYRQVIYGRTCFKIYERVYEEKGTALLRRLPEGCQLVLLDEIGKREKHCTSLRSAIMDTLDGDIPVLGVVQIRPDDFLEEVRSHPKVDLVTLTEENRDAVLHYVNQFLDRIQRG